MSTITSNHLRSCSLPHKWPVRTNDNARKGSTNAIPASTNDWSREESPDASPSDNLNFYQSDRPGNPDDELLGNKTSDEIIVTNLDANVRDYSNDATHTEMTLKHRNPAVPLRRDRHHSHDHTEVNVSQAITAMQKLQRLKELQRRRDLTERYYSQEISRLIGDYFYPRINIPSLKYNEKSSNSCVQQYSANRSRNFTKSLEPCGTMTTITQLDCGCIQETTRPIFTTPSGRVQKKTCDQSQDQVFVKMTSSNPKEHLQSLNQRKLASYFTKTKKKIPVNPKVYSKIPIELKHGTDMEQNKRNVQTAEVIGKMSRNVSPLRKFSDTSTASV